ncbi:MAG: ABC transporter ATP-binding protein [Proteobacteria bacterium]|nr:ABC transporter ATP-binding protein [Pseudomonadota bacterium]
MIRIQGLRKAFGQHQVLRGVDLDVTPGKVLCIIGRSGEGKSVLLKHIIGLLPPDEGDVLVAGTSMVHCKPKARRKLLRRFGMLFQNSALFDSLTVFDNVAFPIRENGEKRVPIEALREIVEEKLELVGLSGVSSKMPSELSGGMRKRVGLARAIALDPEILLYDEPTTGLDPVRTHAVDQLILDTARNLDVTSVVITHDMQAVFEIADEVAFLYDGEIHLQCTPDELRTHSSDVVQSFLAGRPMDDASAGQLA